MPARRRMACSMQRVCSRGFSGFCIGGDRASGYAKGEAAVAVAALAICPGHELAELERRVLKEAIRWHRPMGLGGADDPFYGVLSGTLPNGCRPIFVTVAYCVLGVPEKWFWRRRRKVILVECQIGGQLRSRPLPLGLLCACLPLFAGCKSRSLRRCGARRLSSTANRTAGRAADGDVCVCLDREFSPSYRRICSGLRVAGCRM